VRNRAAALLMCVLLGLYIVLVGWQAVRFVMTGEPIAIAMGVVLIVLPIVGIWALVRELMFGFRTEALVKRLEAEDELPVDDLPKRPSGRPVREAADAEFGFYRDAVEASPEDWRAWFRLGLAYDASGDRRRARAALRTALRLEHAAAHPRP
jgi:cytochrome c-type biogenesis protein CcmH/NrfG